MGDGGDEIEIGSRHLNNKGFSIKHTVFLLKTKRNLKIDFQIFYTFKTHFDLLIPSPNRTKK